MTCARTPEVGATLQSRGLRPIAELAAEKPHGDRLRYMAGCRCTDCRAANTRYETERARARKAGDWNGIVSAADARAHVAWLSSQGIGRRQVADAACICESTLIEVIAGRRKNLRALSVRRILAVTVEAAADHALIPSAPSWNKLMQLVAQGWSQAELARQLGYQRPALQFGPRQITVRNAHEIEKLYERLRMVPAAATQDLLQELYAEGYRRTVTQRLRDLAERRGAPLPDLTVRDGRMLASTAALVEQLHHELTGEEA
jgi:hypothetical protein